MKRTSYPFLVFLVILGAIFISSALTRLLLTSFAPTTFFEEAFSHSIALAVILFPILNYLLLEPLVKYTEEHEKMNKDLELSQTFLESRVQERTMALHNTNERLKQDISQREKVEKELSESETRLMAIFNTNPELISIIDNKGEIKDINDAGMAVMGAVTKTQLYDISINQFIDEVAKEKVNEAILNASEGTESSLECSIINLMEDHKILEMQFTPFITKNNDSPNILCVARDITEHKKLETQFLQSQKMDALGRLAGGVAHDFNNILTAVIGNASFLMELMDKNDPNYEEIKMIKDAGDKAAKLTKQLLLFSKKQAIEPTELNINEIITDLSKMLTRVVGENISLTLSLDPHVNSIHADSGQIEQVLVNLVINARDAMINGGRLSISTFIHVLDDGANTISKDLRPGEYVVVSVEDEGSGMTTGIIDHIFEPFFTTKNIGTGLGLSTVYGIIKQLDGWISVYSELDKGSTFKIYVPAFTSSQTSSTNLKDIQIERSMITGTESIVVVENDESIKKLIEVSLSSLGYNVNTFSNGTMAINFLKENSNDIDLAITDITLSDMTGIEVARAVHDIAPMLEVLYMSGYGNDKIGGHEIPGNELHFISKPFTPTELALKIRNIINKEGM